MHKQLDHPNIVRLLNHFYEEDKKTTYMVLELINGGTLFEKIKTTNMPKKLQNSIFRGICSAIADMHANSIMHRDIKVLPFVNSALEYSSDDSRRAQTVRLRICGHMWR